MNNSRPLVSVVVSTHNRAELVGETIRSVLGQSYDHFEVIVVDDGSNDNTQEVVNSFNDPRIVYVYTENWGGPARPRNIGIRKAKGEYIAFCDDDDIWHPDKLDCQLRAFGNGSFGLCFTNFDYINEDGKKLEKKHKIKKRYLNLTFNKFILGGGSYLAIENKYDYQHFLWKKNVHNGLFYTAFLPRKIANIISNIWYGRPYVNYIYSRRELERLIKRAGFEAVETYAVFPDYRFPQKIIPFRKKMQENFEPVYRTRKTRNVVKKAFRKMRKNLDWLVYKRLRLFGLAPSFIVVARKGTDLDA